MKTIIRSIFCVLLAVSLVISFVGCSTAVQTLPSGTDSEGKFIYAVVRSALNEDPTVEDSAKLVRAAIKDNFGVGITYIKDYAVKVEESGYEILIGETNRPESAEAIKRLNENRAGNYNDFIIAVINNKICIYSKNPSVLMYACEWFTETFCKNTTTWAKLTTDYQFIYNYDGVTAAVNRASGSDVGLFQIVLPRFASYLYGMVAEDIIKHHEILGYEINWFEDTVDAEQEYEILIGDCDRPASKSVTAEGDNYIIKVIGKKIVVKGGNDLATREGALYLYNEIIKSKDAKNGFNWADGYTVNGKYTGNQSNDYTLNWYDEFEGTEVDFNKWGDYLNYANTTTHDSQNGGILYWHNCYGESKYPGDNMLDLMYVSNGNLHLATQNLDGKNFAGALISTAPTMIYRYGLIEVREKFAPEPAACSVWQNGANTGSDLFKHWTIAGLNQDRAAMTEIDIFEDYGQNKYLTSTIHRWWSQVDYTGTRVASGHSSISGNPKYKQPDNNTKYTYNSAKYGDTLIDEYHLMSCYWDGTQIRFAIDGKSYLTINFLDNNSVSLHCLMDYVILSCRMSQGGYCSVNYNNDIHPKLVEAQVDYVRIYQREDQRSQMLTTTTEKKPDDRVINIVYPNNPLGNSY